jgi:hypothetical protein
MPALGFVLVQAMYSMGLISMRFLRLIAHEPHFDPDGGTKSTSISSPFFFRDFSLQLAYPSLKLSGKS